MRSSAALGMALATFLAGLIIGVLSARRSEPPAAPPRARKTVPQSPAAPADFSGGEESARLRQRIHDLERRLSAVPATDVESRGAEEVYAALKRPKIDGDPKEWLKALGRLAELGPTMTPIFVKKYRESRPKVDSVALELALGSGGPEAAVLLKEIFGSPSTPREERIVAGISLSGGGLLSRMMTSVPVDSELGHLAVAALGNSDPLERMGGVGLLGLQSTDPARATLQSLATQDRDDQVRIAALNALGRVGNRATLDYLYSYASASFPGVLDEEQDFETLPLVGQTLHQALTQLAARFPD